MTTGARGGRAVRRPAGGTPRACLFGWLIGAAAALGSSCSSSAVSNQTVSVCYRAIPVGKADVHDSHATLLGVHRVSADSLRSRLPAAAQAELGTGDSTAVCAMEFKGSFGQGQVDLAPATESGDYAVVIVTAKKLQLLGSFVLDHAPKGFGGRTV